MVDSYRVDIADISENLGESIAVSDDLPLQTFVVGAETFTPTGPLHFDVTITNTGTAVIAMGTASLPVLATCVRCLVEFPTEIAAEVDGFYVRPGHEEGVPEEQEIEYIDAEDHIDILPAVMAGLVLEAPFAPLHDEACAGICPRCGADLNQGPCGCDSAEEDGHPFEALRELIGETNADSD
jgi:DUF177 domain-containing protein